MMNISRRLISGSSFRVISLAAHVAVGLYLMPFIVHSLGDRIYGYWALVATILGYYGLFDLGIVGAVQYFVAKSIGEKNERMALQAISTSFFIFVIIGLAIAMITIGAAFFAPEIIHDQDEAQLFRGVLVIMGFGFAVAFPGQVLMGALSAHLRFDLISLAGMGTLLLRTALTILVLSKGHGIVALAAITVFSDLALNGLYYLMIKRSAVRFKLSWDLVDCRLFKDIFSYGFYRFITKIGDRFRFHAHSFIIGGFVGVSAITHYAIASRLGIYFLDFMISSLGLLAPLFSILFGRKDRPGLQKALIISTKLSVAIATFIACCLILYGKSFIMVWMGKSYLDAYIPLVIVVIGIFCDVCQLPSVSYLNGVASHRFLAYLAVIEGIANFFLSLCLVRRYGLLGVALGMAIPMAVLKLLVQPVYICRKSAIPLKCYLTRVFGAAMAVTGMAVILPHLVMFPKILEPSFVAITLMIIFHAIVALPAIYLLALEKEEKDWIMSAMFGSRKARKGTPSLFPSAY
jgi:O-antigen/teichoic acid export membrane protein